MRPDTLIETSFLHHTTFPLNGEGPERGFWSYLRGKIYVERVTDPAISGAPSEPL